MEDSEIMMWKEVYKSFVDLAMHAENVTWNRFSNFLLFNSILILSWATVWGNSLLESRIVFLAAICFLGAVSGIVWAVHGYRGRTAVYTFLNMAKEFENSKEIENGLSLWPKELKKYKPATEAARLRDSFASKWAGSRTLVVGWPLLFTGLYAVMLAITLGWFFK